MKNNLNSVTSRASSDIQVTPSVQDSELGLIPKVAEQDANWRKDLEEIMAEMTNHIAAVTLALASANTEEEFRFAIRNIPKGRDKRLEALAPKTGMVSFLSDKYNDRFLEYLDINSLVKEREADHHALAAGNDRLTKDLQEMRDTYGQFEAERRSLEAAQQELRKAQVEFKPTQSGVTTKERKFSTLDLKLNAQAGNIEHPRSDNETPTIKTSVRATHPEISRSTLASHADLSPIVPDQDQASVTGPTFEYVYDTISSMRATMDAQAAEIKLLKKRARASEHKIAVLELTQGAHLPSKQRTAAVSKKGATSATRLTQSEEQSNQPDSGSETLLATNPFPTKANRAWEPDYKQPLKARRQPASLSLHEQLDESTADIFVGRSSDRRNHFANATRGQPFLSQRRESNSVRAKSVAALADEGYEAGPVDYIHSSGSESEESDVNEMGFVLEPHSDVEMRESIETNDDTVIPDRQGTFVISQGNAKAKLITSSKLPETVKDQVSTFFPWETHSSPVRIGQRAILISSFDLL